MLQMIDNWRIYDPSVEIMVVSRTPVGLLQPELERRAVPWLNLEFGSWVLPKLIVAPEDVYRTARHDFLATKALVRLIQELAPDIVATNTIVAPWAALAAKMVGVPHIWFPSEYGDDHEFAIGVDHTFEDLGALSDLVVANSGALKSYLSRWIPEEKMAVLYPALDFSDIADRVKGNAEWVNPFSDEPETLRVVCVGRIAPSKGQARLVRAVSALLERNVRVEVALVGSGRDGDLASIRSLIEELGVGDRITLTGEDANPFPYIAAADVGVVVSVSEGFGRVTVEYLATGKPVVAARVGATPELVADGRTGLLYDPTDESALERALLTYHQDPTLLAAHGAATRAAAAEIVNRNTLPAIVRQIESCIVAGSAPIERMPHLVLSWMTLPAAAQQMFRDVGASIDPHDSITWTVGNTLARPLRVGRRTAARLARRLVPRSIRNGWHS
ncbi:glycosyltransferase [Cryobacterium sp. Hh38]|uniref:glycosyltransferase n=1 Tax=Cryobacterium sp. Hh38 TaxID=1259156 RepID=UPI001069C6CF|nr:glycosyltransferase [Cryobacterium sp. Hh38]TFD57528.1 glycosyltransferase [Cryobacterium sp. Hh38]